MDIIRKPLTNVIALLVTVMVSTLLFLSSPEMSGLGGVALPIIVWIPLFFGLIFAGAFFIARIFTKDYAWIVTAIGVVFLLIMAFGGVEVSGPLSYSFLIEVWDLAEVKTAVETGPLRVRLSLHEVLRSKTILVWV